MTSVVSPPCRSSVSVIDGSVRPLCVTRRVQPMRRSWTRTVTGLPPPPGLRRHMAALSSIVLPSAAKPLIPPSMDPILHGGAPPSGGNVITQKHVGQTTPTTADERDWSGHAQG